MLLINSCEAIRLDIAPTFLLASSFEVKGVSSNKIFIFTSITSLYFLERCWEIYYFLLKLGKYFFLLFFSTWEKDVDSYTGQLVGIARGTYYKYKREIKEGDKNYDVKYYGRC